MDNTIYILLSLSTIYGIGKFIPQFKLNHSTKPISGFSYPFLVCELGHFVFLGIFQIVYKVNVIFVVVGIINVSLGGVMPEMLMIQRKKYQSLMEQEEEIKERLN